MKELMMKIKTFFFSTKAPKPWEWIILGILIAIPFLSYFYGDTMSIVNYEVGFMGAVKNYGGWTSYYEYMKYLVESDPFGFGSHNYAYATYDFPMYIVRGIWGIPLWIFCGSKGLDVKAFYLGAGGDLQFHLCRIEAIRQALSTGQFPVRISGYWCGGYGYASSVLYGELFLYAPAVLRIIGFSPQDAYKFYLLAVNVFTCFSAYYCLKKMLGERLSAFVGTAVYMLAPYRLSTLHLRAAVGEYTAMAFMPFIIYGLYLIYGRRRGWQWLALGFSGLIQCHVISTFMAGIFTALVCLVRIRQTLSKEVLLQFVRAVVCTVLINAWFLLPFLEYIGFDYNVSGLGVHSRGRFASHAVFISQLISFFPQGEGASIVTGKMWDTDNGMEMSYTLGGGMMLVLVFFVVYRLYDKRRGKRTVCGSDAPKKAGRQMSRLLTGACLLSMLMATTWFPWDFLQQRNDLFAWVTGSIQFPWRFLTISTVAGAFAESEWNRYDRDSRIDLCGTMIQHPIESNIWQMDVNEQVQYLKSIATAGCNTGTAKPEGFVDWIYWKLGTRIAADYMLPYNRKMFGEDLDLLGTYWMEKLPSVSFEETLLSCLTGKAYGNQPGHERFYYPKRFGYGELWNRMADALGERIEYGKQIRKIDFNNKKVTTRDGSIYQADIIVTTIPWRELEAMEGMPAAVSNMSIHTHIR